ncbi:MAG TPA: hypothetical protein VKA04_07740 [Pseudodesulfovibrio sp.]|nr:hypothetical protein [Pseudodesulfovibrio sp.]
MDFNTLMELRRHLAIQHHVPGRIRIKFSLKLLADPRAQTLWNEKDSRTQPSWVRNTKVNMFTRNVIIEYDPQVVQPEKLHEALVTEDEARFSELAAEFQAILES